MKIVAFIPARGGSKRLPGKNTKLLNGIPLIAYSIRYAQYHQADEIVVSTDDDHIAEISKQEGATVIKRPEALAGDTVKTSEVAQHMMQALMQETKQFDCVITLQPTNPLRPALLWQQSIDLYNKKEFDCVLTASINDRKLGKIKGNQFEAYSYQLGERSQDLEHLYFENGLIYCSQPKNVLQGNLFGNRIGTIITDSHTAIDIDYEYDFWFAETLLQKTGNQFTYFL